ncbi:MAG: hypothetical protein HYS12_05145 [Planctomycetes bacterium]|nr:hypothetical protein [Planctomycetota bacterium]
MRKLTSPSLPAEVSAVKLEAVRLALDVPLDASASEEPAAPASHVQTHLKFVQVGVWEARRRCLAGQTEELDVVLAHLDEDIERLCRALQTNAGKPKPRRREKAPIG